MGSQLCQGGDLLEGVGRQITDAVHVSTLELGHCIVKRRYTVQHDLLQCITILSFGTLAIGRG